MANKDDYLTYYREFFENFAQTVNPNDQLPVKLASYKLVNVEVVGGIIDWTTQYLTQKKCPPNLLGPLIKIIIEEIRKACKKQPVLCGFNPSDNAYEPLKLMQTVMAKTNEVCLRYLDNSMLCALPSPSTPFYPTTACAMKNTRRRMEDRHVIIHDLNTMFNIQEASPSSYYAVFDGHAGHDAAAYSSAHLHQFLAENKHFVSNPEQALLDAFCKTDALFTDKCKVENLTSGTTAVVALLRPKEKTLYVAWVGDSQALLVNQGRILQIVNPHKPSRQDERERIEKQGGCVLLWGTWRVNGQLAVSRAIGDAEYKPFVIAVPDVREIPLDGGEDFLILACDGLWDFVTEDQAARTVYNLIAEDPDDIDRISLHLVQQSRRQGSSDNISVIVVFLREPSKIAAEAHQANRNRTTTDAMDAGLDNANNPFAISNGGAATDNILSQKQDGLLLNLTDNFKRNGTDVSPTTVDFFPKEKSNGKRSASEFDDEDFGPETDVDAIDDVGSPMEASTTVKGFGDVFSNNNPTDGVCNPFIEHQELAAEMLERELQKQDAKMEEIADKLRQETPTPPVDAVHDVSGLVENAGDSESEEDEWNYIKGDEANKENISPGPDREVAVVPEEDDAMSQLNPNAAEFIPVSPTRSVPSPACRVLLNEEVISQSPRRLTTNDIDISVPNPADFENEVKSRPSEVDSYSNGHDESDNNIVPSTDLMENLLNGKNIDEIPEFHPGSTPSKIVPSEEFHFGPNAAPFTPSKFLDQSEAGLSTKAVFGDESSATMGGSFNESVSSADTAADINTVLNKESDPMSMSFYAEKDDSTPFDLNQVHVLPDNLEEFLERSEETRNINNDDAINNVQVTDLDKQSYDDEKELASPLEPEKELSEELIGAVEECELPKTPEPTHENLLGHDFCGTTFEVTKNVEDGSTPRDVELISPEPTSKQSETGSSRPESSHENLRSPLSNATEVPSLLESQPEALPRDVELISPELKSSRPGSSLTHEEEKSISPLPKSTEVSDLLGEFPVPQASEIDDLLERPDSVQSKSPLPAAESPTPSPPQEIWKLRSENEKTGLLEPTSLVCQRPEAELPVCERPESKSPVCGLPVASESPICERPVSESPVCERPVSESPVCDKPVSESPVCERLVSESRVCERPFSDSPICERPVSESPVSEQPVAERLEGVVCQLPLLESPVCERPITESPVCELREAVSPVCESREAVSPVSRSPVPELCKSPLPQVEIVPSPIPEPEISEAPIPEAETVSKSQVPELREVASSVCELAPAPEFKPSTPLVCDISAARSPDFSKSPLAPLTPDFTREDEIAKSQEHFETICKSPVQEDLGNTTEDFTARDQIERAQEHFEEIFKSQDLLESPHEEVTSSLKDEHSPIASPLPEPESDLVQDVTNTVQESQPEVALQSPVVNEVESRPVPDLLELNRPSSAGFETLSATTGEQIDIKTDNITPEFAEQAVVTPSEESKQDDVPTAPPAEELVQEPPVVVTQKEEEKKEEKSIAVDAAVAVAAAGAVVAAAAVAVTAKPEKEEKKKTTSATRRAAPAKMAATKAPAKSTPASTGKTTGRPSASPTKAAATKTGTAKLTTTRQATTKPPLRPKTATPTTAASAKTTEKQPLTNGDAKPSPRSSLGPVRKTVSETTAAPKTSRPASAGLTKSSPTKTAAPKPAAPKTAFGARLPTTTTTRTTTSTVTSATSRARPTTLTQKTAAAAGSTVTRTASATKTTSTKTSPKSATAPSAPKQRPPMTTTLAKQRAPLTKTVLKGPDTEKQNKESANKLTASKSVTSTTRTASATARSTTTILRKVESKLSTTRTSKTTTTTTKSATAKKPTEIVRMATTKTKTTKVEKPKENGVAALVTEHITATTVVSGTTTNGLIHHATENIEEQLKDSSPVLLIDNKLSEQAAD